MQSLIAEEDDDEEEAEEDHETFGYIKNKNKKQFRRYHLDKHYLKFWTFPVTLTLNTEIQPFQNTVADNDVHQIKFGSKRINSSEGSETVTFQLYEPSL